MNFREKLLSVLKKNQRKKRKLNVRYTVPSPETYPHQWLIDSCLHALIYLKLKKFKLAKEEIISLIAAQWGNGFIPHIVYWGWSKKHIREWGVGKTSSITQPPMLAYSVERIFKVTGDEKFVNSVFESLDKYYKFLYRVRSQNFILSVIHPWETMEDDLPSWDKVYGVENPSREELMEYKLKVLSEYVKTGLNQREFLKKKIFNVKSLLFNSVYLKNICSMYALGKEIGYDVKFYKKLIPKMRESMRNNLFNKSLGIYLPKSGNTWLKEETCEIFLPMFAEIPTKTQVKFLVTNYLLNPERFWTKYPLPSVSQKSESFDPNRYWRGTTWIYVNWFVAKGLESYGYEELARELKKKSFELVKNFGFREYYNPLNGRGLGARNFAGSGLVIDM